MPHNDGGMFQILIQGLGQEEIARNSHFVLILECDLLHADCLAGVKVVGPLGRALGKSRNAAEGQYASTAAVMPSNRNLCMLISP